MLAGNLYRHDAFYLDRTTGEMKPKYLLILDPPNKGDVIAALLTSQATGRIENPVCSHNAPYAAYFLGVIGGKLGKKSWVDLRQLLDLDIDEWNANMKKGLLHFQLTLPANQLLLVIECAAAADDTTRMQERRLRDALVKLR